MGGIITGLKVGQNGSTLCSMSFRSHSILILRSHGAIVWYRTVQCSSACALFASVQHVSRRQMEFQCPRYRPSRKKVSWARLNKNMNKLFCPMEKTLVLATVENGFCGLVFLRGYASACIIFCPKHTFQYAIFIVRSVGLLILPLRLTLSSDDAHAPQQRLSGSNNQCSVCLLVRL